MASSEQTVGSIDDLILRITDGRTPQEVEQDPEVRLELARGLARHSPAGLAMVTSRGRWHLARHHQIINDRIMKAIRKDEGRLIISASVRSGKSLLAARYAPAWYLGTHPDNRVILGAHEGTFASQHSGFARDKLVEFGPALYGIQVSGKSSARNNWDIAGRDGGLAAVGVGGSPIGKGADALIIDDPFRSYEAAMSEKARKRVNETWYQGSLESRLQVGGTVIVICSRWHEEDLSGWLQSNFPGEWDEIHIPALCDDPENDVMGRQVGESYWPEVWSKERLERIRTRFQKTLPMVWQAQYQQRPSTPEGGVFPIGKINPVTWADFVAGPKLIGLCRGWDLAATEGGGDFTVGVLLGRYDNGRWIILDIVRGQWGAAKVQNQLARTREKDDERWGLGMVHIELPQDPAQAGKSQAGQMTAMLSGSIVNAEVQSGSKEIRAFGFSAQVQNGNVDIIEGLEHGPAMLEEMRAFPTGGHDDCVDAGSTAFNHLAGELIIVDSIGQEALLGMTRDTGLR